MNVTVAICTFGHQRWSDLAMSHARPSCDGQGAHEIIVLHLDDGTLAEARNHAADAATGDWLCFLDADDRLGDGYLDAMRDARPVFDTTPLLEPDQPSFAEVPTSVLPQLLVPAIQYIDNHGRCVGQPEIPAWGRPLIEVNCACIGTLVPRDLFLKVGGFHEWPLYEDWDVWLRCVKAGAQLFPVSSAVYCAHSTPGGRNQPDATARHDTYWAIRQANQ